MRTDWANRIYPKVLASFFISSFHGRRFTAFFRYFSQQNNQRCSMRKICEFITAPNRSKTRCTPPRRQGMQRVLDLLYAANTLRPVNRRIRPVPHLQFPVLQAFHRMSPQIHQRHRPYKNRLQHLPSSWWN